MEQGTNSAEWKIGNTFTEKGTNTSLSKITQDSRIMAQSFPDSFPRALKNIGIGGKVMTFLLRYSEQIVIYKRLMWASVYV